jgi:peptidoglycan/LPS O-acetylase OafA/YrhL
LYISRGLRLVPLYLLAVALMTITVAIITRFQLREPISALCRNVFEWTAFSVSGIPDINRLHNTPMIIAKVTWTLPYEWLFYCALPLLAMSVRVSSRRLFIVGSVGAVAWLAYEIHPEIVYLGAFGAGIAAACIVHFNLIQGFSRTRTASLSAAISLLFAFGFFPTAKQILPLALLSLAFAVVAGGNTLFGTLTWPASRFLGQLTYSMYLLHGLVLFWMFRFVIGGHNAVSYSPAQHWLAIAFCIPVLLILCSITFRFIELPAMKSITGVTRFLQTCLTRRSRLQPLPRPSGIPIEAKQTVTPSASRLWN